MELPEQEMELFLPLSVIGSKNFFNKNIPIWSNDFEIEYETLKRCSPSQPSAQICACLSLEQVKGKVIPNIINQN
jgi:hypothetical protein